MARRTALMVVTLAGMAEHMVSMIEKSGGEREREEREEREAEWANNSASWAPGNSRSASGACCCCCGVSHVALMKLYLIVLLCFATA